MLSKKRTDPEFPSLLKEIKTCPDLLYIKGALPPANMPLITVVGTRRATPYGKRMVEHLLKPLVLRGFGLVSGLAFGIDALAHELALDYGGYTAAILGSGLNRITPQQHEPLARRIIACGGAIISELPPETPIAHKGAFPRRNRLLAGISPMTLVIEAAQKSGAQITAHHAAEYGRDVGAVPGSVFSDVSIGCHSLLKKGAYVITSAEDILEIYHLLIESTYQPALPSLSAEEQTVWQVLTKEPQPLDMIARQMTYSTAKLLTLMTQLELKGVVTNISGQGYAKA
jgi:DNA processing protein